MDRYFKLHYSEDAVTWTHDQADQFRSYFDAIELAKKRSHTMARIEKVTKACGMTVIAFRNGRPDYSLFNIDQLSLDWGFSAVEEIFRISVSTDDGKTWQTDSERYGAFYQAHRIAKERSLTLSRIERIERIDTDIVLVAFNRGQTDRNFYEPIGSR